MSKPIDMILHCPKCGTQHIDEAKPDVCETCGHTKQQHKENEPDYEIPGYACMGDDVECPCTWFEAWLNPPHKSHRCIACNHVWRPADVPTNGVLTIKTKGERDGNLAAPAATTNNEAVPEWARFEYEVIKVRKDLIPKGGELVEAYETEREIIVIGDPEPEPEGLTPEQYEAWEETAHNCDAMGCGTLSHVIYRFDRSPVTQAAPEANPAPGAGWSRDETFQARVLPWLLECFGEAIANDRTERNHRFLEESLELVQALGCSQDEAHTLVDYVYNRPSGKPTQEVGGVMVTLAALCLAQGMNMHEAGETELERIWTKVEEIRAKQAAKPRNSPLPA